MSDVQQQVMDLQKQIWEAEKKLAALKQEWGKGEVQDYELQGPDGPVRLSEAFGDHELMVLVYNMGHQCPYCTLWAEGFNTLYKYIENGVPQGVTKAAFVVVSPETPEKQQEGARKRGWTFRMLSQKETTLAKDLGYEDEEGMVWPGVSILRREGDKITRVARDFFGPGDKYNSIFSFFQLMPGSPSH